MNNNNNSFTLLKEPLLKNKVYNSNIINNNNNKNDSVFNEYWNSLEKYTPKPQDNKDDKKNDNDEDELYKNKNNDEILLEDGIDSDVMEEILPDGKIINYIIHKVTDLDSLERLELFYDANRGDIMKLNMMNSSRLTSFITIKIPTKKKATTKTISLQDRPERIAKDKSKMLPKFLSLTNLPISEENYARARYYLDASNFNLDLAVKMFFQDENWAKDHEKERKKMMKKSGIRRKFSIFNIFKM